VKRVCALLGTVLLAACGKADRSDTVESLIADPDRLKQVQRSCREDRAKLGDEICNAASEAFRRRFMGDDKPHYTPQQ
jgi:hypothetical protein